MPAVSNPKRTPVFRLLTVASSGIGSFILGLWGLRFGFGDGLAGMQAATMIGIMTGLLARPAMVGKIAEAATATIGTGEPVFLIDIDIDRFKQINDAIGYSHGDELIRGFTSRLKENLPKDVVIGRIGAGVFAVLLPDREIRGSIERLIEKLINEM